MEVGDIKLCTVDRITKTIVFVTVDGEGEGSIIMSEIAPGRIRNIRDYVAPGKKIICKVLRIRGNSVDLSLRRVSEKDRKGIRELMNAEKSARAILRTVLGEDAKEIIKKILEKEKVYEFLERVKDGSGELEGIVSKESAEKIMEIISIEKKKSFVLKKKFEFVSNAPNGIEIIKNVLSSFEGVDIKYISAGKYSISAEASEKKVADNKIMDILNELLERSKKEDFDVVFKEK